MRQLEVTNVQATQTGGSSLRFSIVTVTCRGDVFDWRGGEGGGE